MIITAKEDKNAHRQVPYKKDEAEKGEAEVCGTTRVIPRDQVLQLLKDVVHAANPLIHLFKGVFYFIILFKKAQLRVLRVFHDNLLVFDLAESVKPFLVLMLGDNKELGFTVVWVWLQQKAFANFADLFSRERSIA